eukprot:gene20052-26032_t
MTDNDDSNSSFYCPITAEIMKDPVIDREGNSYERKAIEKWIKIHRISPITRNPMTIADLTPNRALKDAIIMQFKDNNNAVKPKKWNLLSFFNYPLAKCKSNKIDEDDLPSETKSPEIFIDPIPTKEVVHFQVPYATLTGNTYRVREHKNKNKILSSNGITPTNNTEIRSHEQELNVHISTSCNKGIRLPTDIVVVIDVSASMSDIANTQVIENSHLCILDIVKHAVNTIIHTLSDQDRLAIVKFSNSANTVLPLTIMNEYGKKSAESALNKLHPNGMTNLWDAIEMALNILKISNLQTIRSVKNSAIFVLTDGEPNIIPAKGNLPMLNQYKENNHGLLPGIINTFGFGYTLDSKLLHDIASIGNGIFSFIPDAGFVGTVFVNALANTLATVITNATLEITPYSGVKIENFDKYDEKQQILSIGGIQSYQTKDIVISAVVPKLYQGTVVKNVIVCQEIGIEPTSYKRIVGIKEDLEGQISMALSRVDWYDRWGIHYLTSLKKSHEMQQCSNFKDLSIRYYGGNTFTEIRDYADEVFCSLPPPTSSNINLLGKYNSTSLKYKDGASFDSPKKIDRNRNSSVDTITETESSTTDSEDKPDLPKKSFDMSAYNNKHSGQMRLRSTFLEMAKRSVGDLTDADLRGKRVFVRVDFNVPLEKGVITDDTRIRGAIPTIKYLVDKGAKVLLSSHLGRPKGGYEAKFSLAPIVPRLSELLGKPVTFVPDPIGISVGAALSKSHDGDVFLLENVRFYPEEEKNDEGFAKKLAANADLYVNDAFGTAHRAHGSTEGVAKYLHPAVAGFLLQKELDYLQGAVENPKRPFAAIVGGSKVSSKITVIETLLNKVDKL